MLVIGELINTSRKAIQPAVINRDVAFISDLAIRQFAKGAHIIDANAGTLIGQEPEALVWLTETIQAVVDAPVCLDSPDPAALEAALKVHKGKAMINSITDESDRFEKVLPLILKYNTDIVALCIEDQGMPADLSGRCRIARNIYNRLVSAGVPAENIYIDPLAQPIGTDHLSAKYVLDTIEFIHRELPGAHTIMGLSNISYGLPQRKLLNQIYFVLAVAKGLDGVILDPLDEIMMGNLTAAQTLLGNDEYCTEYLSASRAGLLDFVNRK